MCFTAFSDHFIIEKHRIKNLSFGNWFTLSRNFDITKMFSCSFFVRFDALCFLLKLFTKVFRFLLHWLTIAPLNYPTFIRLAHMSESVYAFLWCGIRFHLKFSVHVGSSVHFNHSRRVHCSSRFFLNFQTSFGWTFVTSVRGIYQN